jgi:hypothetical protein
MTLAVEAHRALKEFKKAKGVVERLSTTGAAQRLAATTGKATAAVLIADVGDPRDYPSTRAYMKAYGLNRAGAVPCGARRGTRFDQAIRCFAASACVAESQSDEAEQPKEQPHVVEPIAGKSFVRVTSR